MVKRVDPPDPAEQAIPPRRVSFREFRQTIKAIYEAGEPVILTNHGREVACFIPMEHRHWHDDAGWERARQNLKAHAANVAEEMGR